MFPPDSVITRNAQDALAEDLGTGDIHRELVGRGHKRTAKVLSRTEGTLCGKPWAAKVLELVDESITSNWLCSDGDRVSANQKFLVLHGPASSLLTAERTVLNFLQLLSATATLTRTCVDLIKHTEAKLLDTRKTIPGLRAAQKYAVRTGGGFNHRIGLFDAFLIKENHIRATGSIAKAVARAREISGSTFLEVEVENLQELHEAVRAGADRVLLDNFSLGLLREAVHHYAKEIELEASGGINLSNLVDVAETGVHFISTGMLTKNVKAMDLSMQIQE